MIETAKLSEWFWNERVWLPPNVTWARLQSTADDKYFEFTDLGRMDAQTIVSH